MATVEFEPTLWQAREMHIRPDAGRKRCVMISSTRTTLAAALRFDRIDANDGRVFRAYIEQFPASALAAEDKAAVANALQTITPPE